MALSPPPKYPDEILDYAYDWNSRLVNGDTIAVFLVVPINGDITIDRVTELGGIVTFWVSGGTAGTGSDIKAEIITAGGRTFEIIQTLLVHP